MVSVSPTAGLPGYSWSRDSTPRTTDSPALFFVVLTHQAALLHLQRAKALVVRPDTAYGARGRVVTADFSDAAPQFGADGLDQVRFGFDRVCILDRTGRTGPAGCVSSGLFARAAAPDYGQIDADPLEMFFLVAAESLAQADQENGQK